MLKTLLFVDVLFYFELNKIIRLTYYVPIFWDNISHTDFVEFLIFKEVF